MRRTFKILHNTYQYLKDSKQHSVISSELRLKWAKETLKLLNFEFEELGMAYNNPTEPTLFVSNHISYIDIVLIMATIHDCSFVSKKEIASWPLFGTAAKKIGTIFIDRSSKISHAEARLDLQEQFIKHNKKMVVFPSGTTKLAGEFFWKKGSFEIAKNIGLKVQPIRLSYSPLRKIAYIDNDFFPFHFYQLAKNKNLQTNYKAQIEFHHPIQINNVANDLDYCRQWCNFIKKDFKFDHILRSEHNYESQDN